MQVHTETNKYTYIVLEKGAVLDMDTVADAYKETYTNTGIVLKKGAVLHMDTYSGPNRETHRHANTLRRVHC